MKIQSYENLKQEMLAVARGGKQAPDDAGEISYESAAAFQQFWTPEKRQLLMLIDMYQPATVSELAELAQRPTVDVHNTLENLRQHGLVKEFTLTIDAGQARLAN